MVIDVNGRKLNLKEGEYVIKAKEKDFRILNKNNDIIYYENLDGSWSKYEYDDNGELIYRENSNGLVEEWTRNKKDRITCYQNSDGYRCKKEYDDNGKVIYHEDSIGGVIIDKRNKKVELTLDDIAEKFGVEVKDLKIVK